jgi:hypothetical protein
MGAKEMNRLLQETIILEFSLDKLGQRDVTKERIVTRMSIHMGDINPVLVFAISVADSGKSRDIGLSDDVNVLQAIDEPAYNNN